MRKFGVFAATTFIAILLSGLYGTIHDQVTYTISPEYFTKLKCQKFGIDPSRLGGHRRSVALIGFLASWWMGIFIGIMLGLTGLIFRHHKTMRKVIMNGIKVTLVTTILFGFIGYLWGRFYLVEKGVEGWLPDNIVDKDHFIIVGSIHNFSYLGGIAGIFLAIIYMVRRRFFVRKKISTGTAA